jgi:hypothetical protein
MIVDEHALAAIRDGFAQQLAAHPPWKSLIPPDAAPPIHLNKAAMRLHRAALEPFEYDPASKESYFEFLGIESWPPEEPATAIGLESNEPTSVSGGD